MLVHRATWKALEKGLDGVLATQGGNYVQERDNIARLLGYGQPNIKEAMECTLNRATLLGYGNITDIKKGNCHKIPLPPSLENVREPREITMTLAWFTPLNFQHQMYRMAKLWIKADHEKTFGTKDRALGPPATNNNPRGTIIHTNFKGEQAHQFIDDGHLNLQVYCREQAGHFDEAIQYGLAITIEAENQIPIYDEIRDKLSLSVVHLNPNK